MPTRFGPGALAGAAEAGIAERAIYPSYHIRQPRADRARRGGTGCAASPA